MLERSLHKDSCNEVIELALKIPETQVVAFGPESCLRVLFFRAARKDLLDKINMIFTEAIDLITNSHLEALQENLEHRIKELKNKQETIQAFVIYISCADILMGTNFNRVTGYIEQKYRIPVKVFQRGPLSRRKMLPKERLSIIFAEIEEFYQAGPKATGKENVVNVLGEEKILADSLLYTLIQKAKFTINDLSDLNSFEQFLAMARSKLSIVTHPFALGFAGHLAERYQIPYLYLPRSWNSQENKARYRQLTEFLQVEDDYPLLEQAYSHYLQKIPEEAFRKKIAVGLEEDTLDIALVLLEAGFDVRLIFADSTDAEKENKIKKLGRKSRIIAQNELHLFDKEEKPSEIDVAVGDSAVNYYPSAQKADYRGRYGLAFENMQRLIGEIE